MAPNSKKYSSSRGASGRIKRYRDFKAYLIERYGAVVFKLPIDAGFTCPNRDGTLGRGGCIYCDGRGSRLRQAGKIPGVGEQIRSGMEYYRKRRKARLFIPYFQTFTNTFAPVTKLKPLYDEALSFPEAVGMSVGTRPDCFPDEVADLLASYTPGKDVWVEFGLQSIHQKTLQLINRCHSPAIFAKAVNKAHSVGLLVCAHVILGLPGEDREDMMETARALSSLPISGIKIHLLLVLAGTKLADMYEKGLVTSPSMEEYASWVADFLELLPPEVVIQRLTADGYRDILMAPGWAVNKMKVLEAIDKEMERRKSRQGMLYHG